MSKSVLGSPENIHSFHGSYKREREPQVLTHNTVSHGGRAKSFINKYVVQDVKNVNIIKSVQ